MFVRMIYLLLMIVVPVFADDWQEVLFPLLILGTFTGVIPALVIILVVAIVIAVVKAGKKAGHRVTHPEEYRKISEDEKRERVLEALNKDHEYFL